MKAKKLIRRALRTSAPRALRILMSAVLTFAPVFPGVGVTYVQAQQSVPSLMNFQGRLTDASNNPLSGSHSFKFEIYSALTGGTQLWTETQPAVTVVNGVLAAQLGAVNPLTAAVFASSSTYLQITADGVALSPREALITSPFAYNAQSLQGRDYTALVSTDAAQTIAGAKTFTVPVTVPAPTLAGHAATKAYVDAQVGGAGAWTRTAPTVSLNNPGDNVVVQTTMTVQGNAFSVGGSTFVVIGSSVGIGTTSPAQKLDVGGNVSANGMFVGIDGNGGLIQGGGSGNMAVRDASGQWALYKSNGGTLHLQGASAAAGKLVVDTAGNVGIGTTLPASLLDVAGAAQFGSGAAKSTFSATGVLTFPTGYAPGAPLQAATKGYVDAQVSGGAAGWTQSGALTYTANNVLTQSTLTVSGNAFSVGGSTLVVTSGQVGIGTTQPAQRLDLGNGRIVMDNNFGYVQRQTLGANVTVVNLTSSDNLSIGQTSSMNDIFFNVLGTEGMRIKATSGNVGIGTTAPGALLDVNGAAQFGSGASKSTFTVAGNLQLVSGSTITSNGTLSLSTAPSAALTGTPAVFINSQGNVGIGTASPGNTLEVNGYAQVDGGFTLSRNSNIYPAGYIQNLGTGNLLSLSNAGGQVDVIANSGSFGIGTSAPATPLDVNGAAQFGSGPTKSTFSVTGRLTFPTGYSPALALEAANKGYVDAQVAGGAAGWTQSGSLTYTGNNVLVQSTMTVSGNAFSVGGSTLVVSNGNVGIGTPAPTNPLHVPQGSNSELRVGDNTVTAWSGPELGLASNAQKSGGSWGSTFNAAQPSWSLALRSDADDLFIQRAPATAGVPSWSTFFTIKNGGNVGIGTAGPGNQLEVAKAGNTGIRINAGLGGGSQQPALELFQNGAQRFALVSQDAGAIGAGQPGIASGDTAFWSTGNMVFATGSSIVGANTRAVITPSGNIGIGTAAPGGQLDVRGSGASLVLVATKTYSPAGAYASDEVVLARNVTAAANVSLGGSLLRLNAVSPLGSNGAESADLLHIHTDVGANAGNYGFNGNYIKASSGTLNVFTLDSNGNINLNPVASPAYIQLAGPGSGGKDLVILPGYNGNLKLESAGQVIVTGQVGNPTTFNVAANAAQGSTDLQQWNSAVGVVGRVTPAGGFGVGAVTPSYRLHVSSGAGSSEIILAVSTGAAAPGFYVKGDGSVYGGTFYGSGAGLTGVSGSDSTKVAKTGDTMTGQLTVAGSSHTIVDNTGATGTGDSFSFAVTTASDRSVYHLVVSTTGSVGIGTANPGSRLTVSGTTAGSTSDMATFQSGPNSGDMKLNFSQDPARSTIILQSMTGGGVYEPLILNQSGGNVGVGTLNPGAILHATGSQSNLNSFWAENTNAVNGYGAYFRGGVAGVSYAVRVLNQAGTELFVVDGNGNSHFNANLGVGTLAPAARLHVSGGDAQVGDLTASTISASGFVTMANIVQPAGQAGRLYYDSGTSKLRLYNGGWVDIATGSTGGFTGSFVSRAGDTMSGSLNMTGTNTQLTVAGSSVTIVDNNATGTGDSYSLSITTASNRSVYHMVVSTMGNVGVGTANPGARLDVVGSQAATTAAKVIRITSGDGVNLGGLGSGGTTPNTGAILDDANNVVMWWNLGGGSMQLNRPVNINQILPYSAFDPGLTIQSQNVNHRPLVIRAAAGQNLNLTEWQNSGGAALTVVDKGGNIGVGTSSPAARLHVSGGDVQVGDLTASTISASGYVTLANTSQPANATGRLYYDSGTNKLRLYNGGWVDIATGSTGGFTGTFVAKGGDTMTGQLTVSQSSVTILDNTGATGTGDSFSFAVTTASNRSVYHMVVSTMGNVGIGTSNPGAALQIQQPGGSSANLLSMQNGAGAAIGWFDPVNIRWAAQAAGTNGGYIGARAGGGLLLDTLGGNPIQLGANTTGIDFNGKTLSSGAGSFVFNVNINGIGTNVLTLNQGAAAATLAATQTNVGIGAAAPAATLHVSSAASSGTTLLMEVSSGTQAGAQLMVVQANGLVKLAGPDGTTFNATSPGLSLYGTNNSYKIGFESLAGTVGDIRYNVDLADINHGHIFSFGAPGTPTNVMLVRGDGRVGVNTTAPAYALDVTGSINASTSLCVGGVCQTSASPWSRTAPYTYLGASTDKVGIGTATPGWRLHINSGSSVPAGFVSQSDATTDSFYTMTSGASQSGAQAFNFDTGISAPNRLDLRILNDAMTASLGTLMTWYSTGTVGIGTVSPSGTLSVQPQASANYSLFVSSQNGVGTLVVNNQGNVGIGTASPGELLDVNGDIKHNNYRTRTMTRSIPTSLNNEVDIGNFTFSNGGGFLWVSVTVPSSGYSVAKEYLLPIQYAQAPNNVWVTAVPIANTGAYSGNDFALDINVNNTVTSLRLRNTGGATAGTAYVVIKQEGVNTDVFTPSSLTTAVSAPTQFFANTGLTQTGGSVGVGTLAPTGLFQVGGGTITALTSGNVGIGTTNPSNTLSIKPATNVAQLRLEQDNSTDAWTMFASDASGIFQIARVGTGANTPVTILQNGNVGIGTTGPGAILDVLAASKKEIQVYTPSAASGVSDFSSGGVGWLFSEPGAGIMNSGIYTYNTAGGAKDNLAISGRSDIVFQTGSNPPSANGEVMRLNSVGNLGIGVTNPGQKLSVAGTIESTSGGVKFPDATTQTTAGGQLQQAFITSGTSWTSPAGITAATRFKITLAGGGAGGGSGTNVATAVGGGGGAGALTTVWVSGLAASTAYTIAIGAAGAGQFVGSYVGTNGGATTITIGGTTYSANGGSGGGGCSAGGCSGLPGAGGTTTGANGTINAGGHPGDWGESAIQTTGTGGNTIWGGGGIGVSQAAGGNATGYGAGGGGGGGSAGSGSLGGNGAPGAILIEWNQ